MNEFGYKDLFNSLIFLNITKKEVKLTKKSHHVVPAPNGGWNVRKGGSEKASKHFEHQDDAINYARNISKNQGSELYIHKKDGSISRKDSHGKDPRVTKIFPILF